MMKDVKNKAMDGAKLEAVGGKLKCVRECWAPGLGVFREGEIVSGAGLVEKLKGNPNFQEITEEA